LQNYKNKRQNYKDIAEDLDVSKDINEFSSSEEENSNKYKDFPNEAYADLIALVTKYKLSNTVGNAVITFFNKHSNLSKSLLPCNISQGKIYMNNMKSDLSYKKTCVLKHNDSEYFLHYILILKYIKNILKLLIFYKILHCITKNLVKFQRYVLCFILFFNIILFINLFFIEWQRNYL